MRFIFLVKMIFEVVLSCLLVFFTVVWNYRRITVLGKRYPKGPWGVPLFGHLPFLGALPTDTFRNWSEKYGDIFMIRLGCWNTVVVNGEKAIRELGSKKDAFSGRPLLGIQRLLRELYDGNESLTFTNYDASYLHHRKLTMIALRTYTFDREHDFEDLVFVESMKMIDTMLKQKDDGVCLCHELAKLTSNILMQLLYGRGNDVLNTQQMKDMVDSHDDYVESLKDGNVVDVLPWLKYFKSNAIANVKHNMNFYKSIWKVNVDKHIKTFDEQYIRDLTDVFLATKLDETIIIGEVEDQNKSGGVRRERLLYTLLGLFGAGLDTTTSTLRWCFLYMIEFPEVQQRVFEEITNNVGRNRRIVWADYLNLSYTRATLKEIMRVSPALPLSLLHYTTEDTQLDNLDIDKDTVVMINFQSVSHDRRFWGDPQNFRPERYMLANGELDPVKMKYEMTFGVGRRTCVGEALVKKELFLIFTNLIQRYVFSKPKSVMSNFNPVAGLTYSPQPYKTIVNERM